MLRDKQERWFEELHADLLASGLLVPVGKDPAETRLWIDCGLATLAENRFFESLDPTTFDDATHERWMGRALAKGEYLRGPGVDDPWLRPYWLLQDGARAGTLGLDTLGSMSPFVGVSSLHVLPSHRRRGLAARVLALVRERVFARGGAGLRIPTHWEWQGAVRFYLSLGLWVVSWKHSLAFGAYKHLPEHRIEVGERRASFSIVRDGKPEVLIRAVARGERLGWREAARLAKPADEDLELCVYGPATFAVALALRGWPLVRSKKAWAQRYRHSDIGAPEGLAYKIEVFEAVSRQSGFEVRTPRLPGLTYRDYDDIQ
ncbi:MAG: GNAT family N-acetyltransferase [Planctomycetes bacterium]|nr:GNAT family N-acetyltransferase [Planctomycetota bacterium]